MVIAISFLLQGALGLVCDLLVVADMSRLRLASALGGADAELFALKLSRRQHACALVGGVTIELDALQGALYFCEICGNVGGAPLG